MKSSTILREAARLVHDERFAGGCFAISRAARTWPDEFRALKIFRQVRPKQADCNRFWWQSGPKTAGLIERARHPEARAARVVGLCLAAAIAESEGD